MIVASGKLLTQDGGILFKGPKKEGEPSKILRDNKTGNIPR